MSDIPEEQAALEPPKLERIPVSIRLPVDIVKELPFIAVYNHKTSTAEQIREWIVQEASAVMNKASYTKYKQQVIKAHETRQALSKKKGRRD